MTIHLEGRTTIIEMGPESLKEAIKTTTPRQNDLLNGVKSFFSNEGNRNKPEFNFKMLAPGVDQYEYVDNPERVDVNFADLFLGVNEAVSALGQREFGISEFSLVQGARKKPEITGTDTVFDIRLKYNDLNLNVSGVYKDNKEGVVSNGPTHIVMEAFKNLLDESVLERLNGAGFVIDSYTGVNGGWAKGIEILNPISEYRNSIFDIKLISSAFDEDFVEFCDEIHKEGEENKRRYMHYKPFPTKTAVLSQHVDYVEKHGHTFIREVFKRALNKNLVGGNRIIFNIGQVDDLDLSIGRSAQCLEAVRQASYALNSIASVCFSGSVPLDEEFSEAEAGTLRIGISKTFAFAVGIFVLTKLEKEAETFSSTIYTEIASNGCFGDLIDELINLAGVINSEFILNKDMAKIINASIALRSTTGPLSSMEGQEKHLQVMIGNLINGKGPMKKMKHFGGVRFNKEALEASGATNEYMYIKRTNNYKIIRLCEDILANSDLVLGRGISGIFKKAADYLELVKIHQTGSEAVIDILDGMGAQHNSAVFASNPRNRTAEYGVVARCGGDVFVPTEKAEFSFLSEFPDLVLNELAPCQRSGLGVSGSERTIIRSLLSENILKDIQRAARNNRERLTEKLEVGPNSGREEE